MAIETPTYKLLKRSFPFEFREYSGYVTASVIVEAESYGTATNIGFRIVADYIFGNNKKRDKIAMTTPVLQENPDISEKIAMTAPVVISTSKGKYKISFVMPQKYTLKTLPIPNNTRIALDEIPPYKAAIICFSGFVNEKKIDQKAKELQNWIKSKNLKTRDIFQTARYDPPWTPLFLRKNEIIMKVYET